MCEVYLRYLIYMYDVIIYISVIPANPQNERRTNDRHYKTKKVNIQTTETKANASVVLFFAIPHFLKQF